MSYFSIERSGQQVDHVVLLDNDGHTSYEEVLDMTLEDLKTYDKLEEMICVFMDASNEYFNSSVDEETLITLIGDDDVFIWSLLIGPGDVADDLMYHFINWKADGKSYRYEK